MVAFIFFRLVIVFLMNGSSITVLIEHKYQNHSVERNGYLLKGILARKIPVATTAIHFLV